MDVKKLPDSALNDMLWAIFLLSRDGDADSLRFKARAGMAFPVREIDSARELGPDDRYKHELTVNIGGLDGVGGPLPPWLNEILAQEDPEDTPLGDFLNIFSHRFIRMSYLAWEKHKPALCYRKGAKDGISDILLALSGVRAFLGDLESFALNKPSMCPFTGIFGTVARSGVLLECLLRGYFKSVPVRVRQFIRKRKKIDAGDKIRLGRANSNLDANMVLGDEISCINEAFRIKIGPVGLKTYERFLPGAVDCMRLNTLVAIFAEGRLTWDIALQIKEEEIPDLILGDKRANIRLERTTWLGGESDGRESEMIFRGFDPHGTPQDAFS